MNDYQIPIYNPPGTPAIKSKSMEYINATTLGKGSKKTIFTHMQKSDGWVQCASKEIPEDYSRILYLGYCRQDGDMFAAYDVMGSILIYKGEVGDEF